MSAKPFQVVRDFEQAVAEYTGAPFVVSVNSCTAALLLAVAWHLWGKDGFPRVLDIRYPSKVQIPNRTYCSVPMAIIHAGGSPTFRDEEWEGSYQLRPLLVWDCAREFSSGMYEGPTRRVTVGEGGKREHLHAYQNHPEGTMLCVSFHASKILGDTQGGAILHDNPEADAWLRRARFDGRTEGVAPKDDTFTQVGWHCYLSPDVAARLLLKLYSLPKHNDPLPNDPYPDLSIMEIFK